jgi:hypothetical protein
MRFFFWILFDKRDTKVRPTSSKGIDRRVFSTFNLFFAVVLCGVVVVLYYYRKPGFAIDAFVRFT